MPPLWMLLACASPSSDRLAYTRATEHPDDPQACAPIHDPDLRGECVTMAVRTLGKGGQEARARQTCEAMSAGMWRDECWFVLSDALRATGERCADLCQRAARYRKMCLDHGASRQVHDILASEEDDAIALAHLTRALRLIHGPEQSVREARRLLEERAISREHDAASPH